MNFDFSTIMVIATVITGVIWGLDARLWAPKRREQVSRLKAISDKNGVTEEQIEAAGKEPVLVEYARSFFPVILAVLILRSFMVEPFRIPSGSMMPTLLVGDFILVNKFTYGLRLPVVHKKFIDIGEPSRGDVVVFRYPKDPSIDYIKRVIGLPGDRVAYRNRTLYINNERMDSSKLGLYVNENTGMTIPGLQVHMEKLDGLEHQLLVEPSKPTFDGEFVVPQGQYFVMGDNRDNSNDSRYWGFVPEENLVGRAFMIWMNWNDGVNWDRLGTGIK